MLISKPSGNVISYLFWINNGANNKTSDNKQSKALLKFPLSICKIIHNITKNLNIKYIAKELLLVSL